jgi:ATP-binding cassette subfamily F protein 3
VSHDRYFVEKLATKIIEIGHGQALVYPGTYPEFLWHKQAAQGSGLLTQGPQPKALKPGSTAEGRKPEDPSPRSSKAPGPRAQSPEPRTRSLDSRAQSPESREARKRIEAERRREQKAADALKSRIAALEARIAEREAAVKELEAAMSAPGFYDDREASKPVIDRHQTLMWEVGDLISQWEALQDHAAEKTAES